MAAIKEAPISPAAGNGWKLTTRERILLDHIYGVDIDTQAVDREIDRLVYELYGLTAEEIRIVEGATQG